jgi:acetoin utilization deacetylase AcuC-like enzyme
MIGEKVRKLAEICEGKEIDLIASGYNLDVLNFCWSALLSRILGIETEIKEPLPLPKIEEPLNEVKTLIRKIKKEFRKFWKCFQNLQLL